MTFKHISPHMGPDPVGLLREALERSKPGDPGSSPTGPRPCLSPGRARSRRLSGRTGPRPCPRPHRTGPASSPPPRWLRPRGGQKGGPRRRHVLRRRELPASGLSAGGALASCSGCHSQQGGGKHGYGGGRGGGPWGRGEGGGGPVGRLRECGPGAAARGPRTALVHSTWDGPGHERLLVGALPGGEEERGR